MPSVIERNETYYTDDEVANLLGISLGRLRNKLCAGNPLPPRIEPPGCRHRLWPCQAVHDWLEQSAALIAAATRDESIAFIFAKPVLMHTHGAEFHLFHDRLPKIVKQLINKIFQSCTYVIVLSQSWKQFYIKKYR